MILICIIVYQQFVFHNGTKAKIHEISSKLKELLDTDSDEKVTVFTDNKALIELCLLYTSKLFCRNVKEY